MKKLLALFFAVALVFSLVACDSADSNQTTAGGQEDTSAAGGNQDDPYSYQDTYQSLTEAEFLAAVENSTICVHAKGGVELKFYLDDKLNILAVDCSGGPVTSLMNDADYISPDMSFADGVRNIYLYICDNGMIPYDAGLDAEVVCEMPEEAIDVIDDEIIEAFNQILDLTGNYMSQQYNFTEGTVD